nr:sulfite exporter TauE/SafE family protein [Legionella norrlandica]
MSAELLVNGIIYITIGAFAGIMAGALGVGGGLVVVPGLAYIFQHSQIIPADAVMHVAAGCSLTVMIFTSYASLKAHNKMDEILLPIFKKLWPGLMFGTVFGALIASVISTNLLKIIFGLFLIAIAIKMFLDGHVSHSDQFPGHWVNALLSSAIGSVSGLLGVGGGVMVIPYLTYCGVPIRKIPAISNLGTFVVGIVGTIMFMITGTLEMPKISYSWGYIYWPAVLGVTIPSTLIAPLGVKLNYILPINYLRYGFIVILFITAIHMLL